MRLHNLPYQQKAQPVAQIKPFIGTFHIMWLFFQTSYFNVSIKISY